MNKAILLLITLVGIFGCSGDDSSNTVTEPILEVNQNSLQGTWILTAENINGIQQVLDSCRQTEKLVFYDNIIEKYTSYAVEDFDNCFREFRRNTFTVYHNNGTAFISGNPVIKVGQLTATKLTVVGNNNLTWLEYKKED